MNLFDMILKSGRKEGKLDGNYVDMCALFWYPHTLPRTHYVYIFVPNRVLFIKLDTLTFQVLRKYPHIQVYGIGVSH